MLASVSISKQTFDITGGTWGAEAHARDHAEGARGGRRAGPAGGPMHAISTSADEETPADQYEAFGIFGANDALSKWKHSF